MQPSGKRGWLSHSYIGRHWRGELSLPVSYFVNGVLVTIAVTVIVYSISAVLSEGYAPWPGFLAIAGVWGSLLLIYLWQMVGIWRSADNHPNRGGRAFWAGVAKFMVIIGVLQTANTFTQNGWPQIRESFRIATGDPDIGTFTLRLMNGGTEIEFAGGMPFGAAEELAKLLDAAPQVHTIHLDSHGGRIGAAIKLRDLIRERGLNTYVSGQCLSACTVAYLGGRERYIHPEGRLGFHAGSFPGVSATDMRFENQRNANEAVALGVERRFAEKAYLSPSDSMWFPTTRELIEARFVTRIASPASVAEGLLTGPTPALHKVIKQYAPEEFGKLIEDFIEIANTSTSHEEAYYRRAGIVAALRRKYASFALNSPDEFIRAAIKSRIEGLRLFVMDRENCSKFVIYGPMDLSPEAVMQHVDHFDLEGAALFRALFEGAKAGGPPKISSDADWDVFIDHWLASGATDQDIASMLNPGIDDPNLCPAWISFLEAMLSAEGPEAERVRASYVAETASN